MIKLAIIDKDRKYLEGVQTRILTDYSKEVEIYMWLDTENLTENLSKRKIDILVVNTQFKDEEELRKVKCPIIFIDDNGANGTVDNKLVLPKYQNITNLYNSIKNAYYANINVEFEHNREGRAKIIAFTSPAGGTGTSTLAEACAVRLAQKGKKPLYINLEKIPAYFFEKNYPGFEEILYAIDGSNFILKLESGYKESPDGVCFLPRIKKIPDLISFTTEQKIILITTAAKIEKVTHVIVDMGFSLDSDTCKLLDIMDEVIFVSDGTENSNNKIFNAFNALKMIQGDYSLDKKISLVYNKFSIHSPVAYLAKIEMKSLGVIYRKSLEKIEDSQKHIVNAISESDVFDALE